MGGVFGVVASVGVLLVLLAGAAVWHVDTAREQSAREEALAVTLVADAAETYVREQYFSLERCLEPLFDHSVGASAVLGIPVFSVETGALVDHAGAAPYFGGVFAASAGCDPAEPAWQVRSLEGAGLLPVLLDGLAYPRDLTGVLTGQLNDTYAYGETLLDFRVGVRLAEITSGGGRGLQVLVTAVAPGLDAVRAVAITAAAGRGGIVRSGRFPGTLPHRTVEGRGWRFQVCSQAVFAAALGGPTPCPPGVPPTMVLDLDAARASGGTTPADTDARLLFGRDALLAGQDAARVVLTDFVSRASVLDDDARHLHRFAVPGAPERNRMETVLDAGGWGLLHAGYAVGLLDAAGTSVTTGPRLVGPPSGSPDPVTVVGDLRVRGVMQVGGAAFVARAPLVAGAGEISGGGVADTARLVLAPATAPGTPTLVVDSRQPGGASGLELGPRVARVAGESVTLGDTGTVRVRGASGAVLETRGGAAEADIVLSDLPADGVLLSDSGGARLQLRNDDVVLVPATAGFVTLDGPRTVLRGRTGARFAETGDLGGALQSRTLHAAAGRYTPWAFGGPCPAVDPAVLGAGPASANVAVMHGWNADRHNAVSVFQVVQSIDGVVGNPVTGVRFTTGDVEQILPYVGWWADPRTGRPGPAGSVGANAAVQQDTRATVLTFCDWR